MTPNIVTPAAQAVRSIERPTYDAVFSQADPKVKAEVLRNLQEGRFMLQGFGGVGPGIFNRILYSGMPSTPVDIHTRPIDKGLESNQTRIDKAQRARAISNEMRAHIQVAGLQEEPIILPNDGRLPDLGDVDNEKREIALQFLEDNFDPEIRERIKGTTLYIEALPENLALKQKVLEFISYVIPENAIIATNTSSLSIDEVSKYVKNPERVVGLHFFKPADQIEAAEVILGSHTSPDTASAAYDQLKAGGARPYLVHKDRPLAAGNRLFVATLRKLAELVENGEVTKKQANQIYKEVFYSEQVGIQFSKAKEKMKDIITLDFFEDEGKTYNQVYELEEQIKKLTNEEKYDKRDKLLAKKIALLEQALDNLNQKILYASVVENAGVLGEAFETPRMVKDIKDAAIQRYKIIDAYLREIEQIPAKKLLSVEEVAGGKLETYEVPDAPGKPLTPALKKQVKDKLVGTYIAAAQAITNEGIVSVQDLDSMAMTAFGYNEGTAFMADRIICEKGIDEVKRLMALANEDLSPHGETGIARPEEFVPPTWQDLSGVQVYRQGDTATIEFDRNQLENLMVMHNTVNPYFLRAFDDALETYAYDPKTKVNAIFLENKGGKVDGSGASLGWIQEQRKNNGKAINEFADDGYHVVAKRLFNSPVPVIDMGTGSKTGGTFEISAACTERFGSYEASGALPERMLRLVPLWGGTENVTRVLGKELTYAFATASSGGKIKWMTADMLCRAGFYGNSKPMLRGELYQLKADLIAGKVPGMDIRNYKRRPDAFDKRVEDYDIRRAFGLGRLDKPPVFRDRVSLGNFFGKHMTRDAAVHIKHLILNADDPTYRESYVTPERLHSMISGALTHSDRTIEPLLWASKNKYAARALETLQGGMIGAAKVLKKLMK